VVTGAKRFPADLRLDGMGHGCVLRAPAFGATLRTADTRAAEALPGVRVIRDGAFIGVVARSAAEARQEHAPLITIDELDLQRADLIKKVPVPEVAAVAD